MSAKENPETPESINDSQKADTTESMVKSYSKTETIAQLQQTIRQLETIITKLNQESIESFPVIPSLETLISTTQDLALSFDKTTSEATVTPVLESITEEKEEQIIVDSLPIIPPETVKSGPTFADLEEKKEEDLEAKPLDKLLPSFNTLQTWWDGILIKIRSFLPKTWNEKLSDWGLTSIITGMIVLLLSTSVLLVPQQQSTEIPEIAPPEVPIIETPVIDIPPQLEAPKQPQPIETIEPPKRELTPEQSLITAIKNQVAEITNIYSEGLIDSIEVNFLASRLSVKVSDNWYSFSESRQNKLADEMLSRSQQLDFKKLEIMDSQGELIARNPVIGTEMIILKRSNSIEEK
jgi:hypothetical protein